MTATSGRHDPRSLLDELPMVSTSDRGQTVVNQLAPLQEAAGRLGWTVGDVGWPFSRLDRSAKPLMVRFDALNAAGCERCLRIRHPCRSPKACRRLRIRPWGRCAGRRPARSSGAIHAPASDHRHRSTHRPVQKSPSLTVAESWLPTVVSSGHADRIQNHAYF